MATKNFTLESNQKVWNAYNELKLAEGKSQPSINQYKPAFIAIEKMFNVELNSLTADQLEEFLNSGAIKNTGHIRGFLITCINEGLITPSKEVIAKLIPSEYKQLVQLLVS